MKVYVNDEAVSVYYINLGIGRSVSSAACSKHNLPLRKVPQQHSLNMRLDGHHTYNGDNIPMHGDWQVKLNTLI